MAVITAGELRQAIAGLHDEVLISFRLDLKRGDGRRIAREAKFDGLESRLGEDAYFDWADITLSANLAPESKLWGMVEEGQITEEDYWEMVAR